jgi:hypothetical protein
MAVIYTLAVNAAQLTVIRAALELYERVGMGQFAEVASVHGAPMTDGYELAEAYLLAAKKVLRPELGRAAYYGIGSPVIADRFRVAYDVEQVIRYRLAWDRDPEGRWQYVFDVPRRTGTEPLAVIASVP